MARNRNISEQTGLAELFEICTTKKVAWGEEDLGDIFRHQLDAPLLRELELSGSALRSLDLDKAASKGTPIRTFDDLLHSSCPPLGLLRHVKDFAKDAQHRLSDALPAPVTDALYVLTLAVALTRRGDRISAMDDSDLRRGFEWVSGQSWIEASLRQIAEEAIALLGKR
jgi:hypothetical protein